MTLMFLRCFGNIFACCSSLLEPAKVCPYGCVGWFSPVTVVRHLQWCLSLSEGHREGKRRTFWTKFRLLIFFFIINHFLFQRIINISYHHGMNLKYHCPKTYGHPCDFGSWRPSWDPYDLDEPSFGSATWVKLQDLILWSREFKIIERKGHHSRVLRVFHVIF